MRKKVQVWVYVKVSKEIWVLLLKMEPSRGGFWQPVTGGVEEGEVLEAAALREVFEETGFSDTRLLDLKRSFQFEKAKGEIFEEFGFGIALEDKETPQQLPEPLIDPREHVAFQWVRAQDAFELLEFPSNADMLNTLLQQLQATA